MSTNLEDEAPLESQSSSFLPFTCLGQEKDELQGSVYGAEPAQTHQVAGNDQRGARQSQNGVVQPLQPQEHRLGTTGMRQVEIGCFSSPKPLLNQLCTGKVIKKGLQVWRELARPTQVAGEIRLTKNASLFQRKLLLGSNRRVWRRCFGLEQGD